MYLLSPLSNQRGAIFGLDARVALAIFSVLSVVAGVTSVLSVQSIRAKSLAQEMDAFGTAIESMQHDLKTDIFTALITPSEESAFRALYDNIVLEETQMRPRWLGPYINVTSNVHPKFGERIVSKRSEYLTEDCNYDGNCFLWLIYEEVPKESAEEANTLLDGAHEKSPESEGRVQWRATDVRNRYLVGYRVSTTLNSGDLIY